LESGLTTAKHLETLQGKDGGVPLEIYKRTKDEKHNEKTFSNITDVMKSAGVLHLPYMSLRLEKSRDPSQG